MSRVPLVDQITQLLQTHHVLTAPDVVEAVAALGKRYNKTSIYRALDKLAASGVVCQQHLGGPHVVYELREHHHDHLVCTKCGVVEVVSCTVPTPSRVHDFVVDHHHLTLYGVCARCQAPTHHS